MKKSHNIPLRLILRQFITHHNNTIHNGDDDNVYVTSKFKTNTCKLAPTPPSLGVEYSSKGGFTIWKCFEYIQTNTCIKSSNVWWLSTFQKVAAPFGNVLNIFKRIHVLLLKAPTFGG